MGVPEAEFVGGTTGSLGARGQGGQERGGAAWGGVPGQYHLGGVVETSPVLLSKEVRSGGVGGMPHQPIPTLVGPSLDDQH